MQWFRAEADMYRWLEHFESKHAEFERCIASFQKMESVWESLAETGATPGHCAYARKQYVMYRKLRTDAQRRYKACGFELFVTREDNVTLAEAVASWRQTQFAWMDDLVSPLLPIRTNQLT